MIEAYAFLAAFALQVLSFSVLQPFWFNRYARAKATTFPAERFAQLYPGVDPGKTLERYLTRYNLLNAAIAVLGSLALGFLFNYVLSPNWDEGVVKLLVTLSLFVQILPICLVGRLTFRYEKLLELLLDGKRKATLQRRGLLDYVSPFTVFLPLLAYFLFVAYVIYLSQNPFDGFDGYTGIVPITLVYAINAFGVYRRLYGRKVNPLETQSARMHATRLGIKFCAYSCVVIVMHRSISLALKHMDLLSWQPFALSLLCVCVALLGSLAFTALPRRQDTDDTFGGKVRLS